MRIAWGLLGLLGLLLPRLAAADDLFALSEIEAPGRSVAAELADLDGDGDTDLFVVSLVGLPPAEERLIRVHLQADGALPPAPDYVIPVPRFSSVYDIADLAETPGHELVLLGPSGVVLLSLGTPEPTPLVLPVPGATTLGPAEDERGFEPFKLVYDGLAPEPWIVVPQIGQLTALAPSGEVRAQLDVQRRANYLTMPETGLVAIESDFQAILDHPKLALGDVDGDGRTDMVTATRHEVRVFLQKPDGGFDREASRRLPLGLVTPRDHIRGSGGVSSVARDVDGDGRMDLLVSHVQGSFTDSNTVLRLFMNEGGAWDLTAPTQVIEDEGAINSAALVDFDGDGRLELLRLSLRFGLLEVIETLLSREVDVQVAIHGLDETSRAFEEKPSTRKQVSLGFSFETSRPNGFLPTATSDLNGDGYRDFVSSGDGEAIEVYLGGPGGPFDGRPQRQSMETTGVLHFGDVDGDRLPDFVLFNPHHFDAPVRIGRNLGALKGTAPKLTAPDAATETRP